MGDFNNEEPLSNLSESSFVILGQGSLSSNISNGWSGKEINTKTFNMYNDISLIDKSTFHDTKCNEGRKSDIGSFFEGDAQKKLNQLLQENFQLRETLSQNNLAIKSQLDSFITWQQEVLKTHEAHKQTFLEKKELIFKLQTENANLKKQLEQNLLGFSIVSNGDMQPLSLVNNLSVKNTNPKSAEVDGFKEEIKKLEEICMELTIKNENISEENCKLKENLKDAENKILKISKDLEDIVRENNFLKQKNNEFQKNSMENVSYGSLPNSEARVQISNLFEQLAAEKAKVLQLKEEVELVKSNKEKIVEPKLAPTEELNHCISKLDDMNVSFDKQSQRFNSIISWVSLTEENLNALKENKKDEDVDCLILSEIAQLKSHLHQEENAFKKKQENLQEMHGQFNKLLKDYKDLQKKLSTLESSGCNTQKYKDEIKSLSEQLKVKDEDLISKQQECDKLKEDIKKLNLECEEIAILKVQVQLYQTDFNDERQARETLAGEKEKMAEQIRLLQSKLENFEQKEGKEKDKNSSGSGSSSSSEKKKSCYICPKCMFSFSDLERCEKHVDECLNIHFYP